MLGGQLLRLRAWKPVAIGRVLADMVSPFDLAQLHNVGP